MHDGGEKRANWTVDSLQSHLRRAASTRCFNLAPAVTSELASIRKVIHPSQAQPASTFITAKHELAQATKVIRWSTIDEDEIMIYEISLSLSVAVSLSLSVAATAVERGGIWWMHRTGESAAARVCSNDTVLLCDELGLDRYFQEYVSTRNQRSQISTPG